VAYLGETALTALLEKHAFQLMNEELVQKQKKGRQEKTKNFGQARVLVAEALKEERKTKEKQDMDEKERKAALRGLVAFTKVVWREFKMGIEVFQ
jgi:hypothetical protein